MGLVALLGSTVLLFIGQSIGALVVARVLQGVSAAVVWTIGLAMILDTVGSEKLGVTIGSIFSFISVGELAAPVLGGVVYKKAGYVGVFAMGFGILILDFIMRLIIIEKKTAAGYAINDEDEEASIEEDDEQNDEQSDGAGELGEESPLLSNGEIGDEDHWKIRKDLPSFVKKFPILYCFSNSRLIMAQVVSFIQAILLAAFDATITTEAQYLFQVDSLKAGLLFVPLILPYLLFGSIAGNWVDKYGTKPAAVLGFAFIALPLVLLRIPQPGGTGEVVKFCVFISMCGVGLAIIGAPSIVEASYVAEKYHKANKELFGEQGPYAQLYAINSMVRLIFLTSISNQNTWQISEMGSLMSR